MTDTPDPAERQEALRALPQVDAVLRHPSAETPVRRYGRARVADAVRTVVEQAREEVLSGATPPGVTALIEAAAEQLAAATDPALKRVLNATGVVLHTNLGRAPLSAAARRAVADAAGYATVEYDLDHGTRGSRTAYVGRLIAQVCGTEAGVAVNNGAAALLLALAALAGGREVIVSRGELIEIGGSYRLPEVMAAAGVTLVEVGTTNRTRIADYRAAVGEDTGLLLKVHQSNYRMVGFAEATDTGELAALAEEAGVPFVYDLGSGLLAEPPPGVAAALDGEPTVTAAVAAGTDAVIFSGDKLLGGPQAGLLAGDGDLVEACRRHPLARAVRIDKLQRAALEATLAAHLGTGDGLPSALPVGAMLTVDPGRLEQRARELARQLGDPAEAVPSAAVVGGGAVPGTELDSYGVALDRDDPDRLAAALRRQSPPVIARVEEGRVVIDLRTIAPNDDTELADLLLAALGATA